MSHCLNPFCQRPQNPDTAKFCSNCGFKLLLGDRYRAVQAIARGGFGRTFLAVDEYKPSRPRCVIKQFYPQNQNPDNPERARELFRREAIQLENLGQHPQIPELLAHFEQANYQYLVQEWIDGNNLLQELARQGVFSEVQVWQLLNDLLPVLEFIHQQQVIHRDIKPQNIIRRQSNQQYVLVDFGAAKSITGVDLARTGTSIGSPEFTAPEQALGKATYASDLYSLGVTCIYLLTQVRPADLFDTEEGVWVWHHHLTTPVNHVLGEILDKLLQGPVKRRYQSATDVLQAIHAPPILAALGLSDGTSSFPPLVNDRPPLTETPILDESDQITVLPDTTSPMQDRVKPVVWGCQQTLSGHSSWVRSVAIHPSGQTFASGSGDKTIKIWDLQTGEVLRTIAAHDSWVRAIAISPDGKQLVSCSNDRQVKLWQWETGELVKTLSGHTDWVRSVAFSADGSILASSSQDKSIRLWRVATGEPLRVLSGHRHWVTTVTYVPAAPGASNTPADQIIASGSRDKTIRLWQGTGKVLQTLEGHTDAVNAIAIGSNSSIPTEAGLFLASGSDDSTIRLWDLEKGAILQTLTGHEGAVNSVVISPDGNYLISASHDRTIKIWCLQTMKLLYTALHPNWVWSVAISPDGKTILSGSWDGTIKIWQPEN